MRPFFFVLSLFLGVFAAFQASADVRTYGPESPTKMYLFTSLACPHCAQFHQKILPDIRKKYVGRSKGQLIVVDMMMNQANLMGATLLRCVPKDQVHAVEAQMYEDQKKWAYDERKAYTYLLDLAQKKGMSTDDFASCVHNKELQKGILFDQEKFSNLYGVSRMPTFIIRRGKRTKLFEGADKEEIMKGLDLFFQ